MEQTTVWYNQPLIEDVDFIRFENGIGVIPYDLICEKLDRLTDYSWGSKNFVHHYHMINGVESISASIEVNIGYHIDIRDSFLNLKERRFIHRTLAGACTYPLEFFRTLDKTIFGDDNTDSKGNEHYAASAKSLCIVNAVKPIGVQFGRDLNSKRIVTNESFFNDMALVVDEKLFMKKWIDSKDVNPKTVLIKEDTELKRAGILVALELCKTKDAAIKLLNKTEFFEDEELIKIANSKK